MGWYAPKYPMMSGEEAGGASAMETDEQQGWAAASLTFPLARIKKIIKADKDVGMVQNEALLATCAAAVLQDAHPSSSVSSA